MRHKWTEEEKKYVLLNYRRGNAQQIADEIGRSVNTVRQFINTTNLSVPKKRWSTADIKWIETHYPDSSYPLGDMADYLGASISAIRTVAQKNKIYRKKSVPEAFCIDCGCSINKFYHTKRCLSCSNSHRSGERHHNWKGGISTLTDMVRRGLYDVWTRPIMSRDHFKCRICGNLRTIQVHHLRPLKSITDEVLLENPNLSPFDNEDRIIIASMIIARHVLDEGITLCKHCHISVHYSEKPGELLENPNVKTRAISSQASEGIGSEEGSTTRRVSPNNNPSHERPASCGAAG